MDACAGTFAIPKDCMLLQKQGRRIGCEVRSFCFRESLAKMVKVYSGLESNVKLKTKDKEAVQDAARVIF